MNNKKRTSLKTLILLPVFILGALTIICNVMAINNIRTVNSNAADITDNCMTVSYTHLTLPTNREV